MSHRRHILIVIVIVLVVPPSSSSSSTTAATCSPPSPFLVDPPLTPSPTTSRSPTRPACPRARAAYAAIDRSVDPPGRGTRRLREEGRPKDHRPHPCPARPRGCGTLTRTSPATRRGPSSCSRIGVATRGAPRRGVGGTAPSRRCEREDARAQGGALEGGRRELGRALRARQGAPQEHPSVVRQVAASVRRAEAAVLDEELAGLLLRVPRRVGVDRRELDPHPRAPVVDGGAAQASGVGVGMRRRARARSSRREPRCTARRPRTSRRASALDGDLDRDPDASPGLADDRAGRGALGLHKASTSRDRSSTPTSSTSGPVRPIPPSRWVSRGVVWLMANFAREPGHLKPGGGAGQPAKIGWRGEAARAARSGGSQPRRIAMTTSIAPGQGAVHAHADKYGSPRVSKLTAGTVKLGSPSRPSRRR